MCDDSGVTAGRNFELELELELEAHRVIPSDLNLCQDLSNKELVTPQVPGQPAC